MSRKYKKTCKYLNHVEHFLVLVSTIIDGVSVAAFASLISVPVGITNTVVILKFLQSLQELKSIIKKSQLSTKIRRSMMK